MREWLARLIDWIRRDTLDAELAEELRHHRQQLERDARAAGAGAEIAVSTARRKLGNLTRVTEDARERWSWPVLDHVQQDMRYAVRGLRRSPGFTFAVVLTLGLGIGANAAMFGVIDRLMFRPFPYLRDPGSVDRVYVQMAGRASDITQAVFPYTRYVDLERWTTSFSDHAAFTEAIHGVGSGEGARERPVVGVTGSFFGFFDARPALGRFFIPAEDTTPAGANVAVLGFAYWKSELSGGDVIGKPIQVGNAQYRIIGVAPEEFAGVSEGPAPAVYVPITAYAFNQGGGSQRSYFREYNWDWTQMIVRREPGVSRAAATADLREAAIRSWNASREVHPRYGSAERMRPRALAGAVKAAAGPEPGLEARTLVWVTGVAAIVLLIACANVANLFLSRALRRRRETALRLALGVSRARLTAQSLTESVVVSLLGCVAGIVVAQWGGSALRRLFIPSASAFDVVRDWRTVAVAVAAALFAAVLTGIAPVLFAGRADITATLKSGAREGTYQRSRARDALLVAQGALSVVLLVGAGLFVRSLGNVRDLRLGYDVKSVLLVEWERRGTSMDSAGRAALRRRLLETALAIPGVERGAWVSNPPFASGTSTMALSVAGIDSVSRLGRFTFQMASADYFATMRTGIRRGRSFTDSDRSGTPRVMVVSEAMARTLWPRQDALGQCVRLNLRGASADTMPCTTVIGIAENVVHDPAADYPLRYYIPELQVDLGATLLLLRMRGDPAREAEAVRRTLQAVMPGQAHVVVQPARDLLDAKLRSWQVGATMFVAFGVLALVVAAVGLYSVISYNVGQRMHELGVRIALGAQSSDVVRLVVGQGARFAIAGLLGGSVLALVAARWVQPLLFHQSARDPVVFTIVAVMLLAVALIASALPAIRATRSDPNTVLRAE